MTIFAGNSGAVYNSNGVAFVAQGVWSDKIGVSEILVFNGTDPTNLYLKDVQSLTYSRMEINYCINKNSYQFSNILRR